MAIRIESIVGHNEKTDILHFFDPGYHAQSIGFVGVISTNLKKMKQYDCDSATMTQSQLFFAARIGETLHVLQDIYAHTDWVDGNDRRLVKAYRKHGYDWDVSLHVARGAPTPDFLKLEAGDSSEFTNVLLYTGGTNPVAKDPHNLFAADKAGKGRDRIIPGAFTAAQTGGQAVTTASLTWVKDNVKKCCRSLLFRE